MPTLIITNDFPPRIGGIESFVREVCRLLDDDVLVLTSGNADPKADRRHDHRLPFPVIRLGRMLLPTPRVGRIAVRLMREHASNQVVFGAAAPLSLLAPRLRRAGADRILALSHGHETWWARLPPARQLLCRMVDGVDGFGVISAFTGERIAAVLRPDARAKIIRIPPPVDTVRFRPLVGRAAAAGSAGSSTESGWSGLDGSDRPRCIAVGRFVHQKGFDTLLAAWTHVLAGPIAARRPELILVGEGPRRPALEARVGELGLGSSVHFTGAIAHDQLPGVLQQAQVFALPVRTRWWGLNPEGLGLGFCEAAACGLPVVVGRSGGAPETVLDGVSGYLVEPDDVIALADRLGRLLGDPELARRMGAAGRAHVLERFGADRVGDSVRTALGLPSLPDLPDLPGRH